jgi:hypothetical protein
LSPPFDVQFTNTSSNYNQYVYTWDFGDGNSFQNQNTIINHTYQYNGTYDVTLYGNDNSSNCVYINTRHQYIYCTGGQDNPNNVDENQLMNITISPNPTFNIVKLEINSYNGPINIMLFDLNGNIVEEYSTYSFNMQSLESGIYFALISYDDNCSYAKILKY